MFVTIKRAQLDCDPHPYPRARSFGCTFRERSLQASSVRRTAGMMPVARQGRSTAQC